MAPRRSICGWLSLATKKKAGTDDAEKTSVDPNVQLLHDIIVQTFVSNAATIAKYQKPEALLKMIQTCDELKPIDRSNQELWKLIQKARRAMLAEGKTAGRKTRSRRKVKVKN